MDLNEDNIVTLDFETYYDKDYTLSKLNTSEYIRDPRFHAHCVGIKIGRKPTKVYYGADIPKAIKKINWSKHALLAHNVAFDGFILTQRYGVTPAFYLDTLSMSRAIHGHAIRHNLDTVAKFYGLKGKVRAKALSDTKGLLELSPEISKALGDYCADDVDDTYELFWRMLDYMPNDELELIHITTRMFTEPALLIDKARAQAALDAEVSGKITALLLAGTTAEQLMSNDKFAELLRDRGHEPPKKISPTTGDLTYAFAKSDEGFKELLNHQDESIRLLADARMKVKSTIGETRAARMLEAGKDDYRLPVLLNYYGAHTGRWSGGNKINFQNLPRGGELRKSILAPDGYVIAVADSAQIEARVTAWLAGQEDLLAAFRARRDVYSEFATKAFGYPVDRKKYVIDPATGEKTYPQFTEGFIGKTCVLGLGFGMGWMKLRATLAKDNIKIDIDTANELVDVYREVNWAIPRLWRRMEYYLARMSTGVGGQYKCLKFAQNSILLPNGLALQYPHLEVKARNINDEEEIRLEEASYATLKGRTHIYGGLLTENVVQALARCIVAEQLRVINKRYQVVMTTHDEVAALVPAKEAAQGLDFMITTMSTPPAWAPDLPIFAEGGYDACYSK